MRKNILFTILMLGLLLIAPSQAMATVYEFYPPDQDMFDLDHHDYYLWGINWGLAEGEELVSVTLSIDHINNWDNEENILYIHLLDSMREGLHVYEDDQQGGDNIARLGDRAKLRRRMRRKLGISNISNILLDTYIDHDGGRLGDPEDYVFEFTEKYLYYFEQFAQDGNFGFGFDPDCHFYNNGVYLTIETRTVSTPEPATMALFGTGLLGAFFRRKFT